MQKPVSILVSYWMGWELYGVVITLLYLQSFNPSFLLDGLGIYLEKLKLGDITCFNPSFLLDGLGIQPTHTAETGKAHVSILVSYWMGWE